MSAHARFAPSSMARTVACAASVTLAEQFPDSAIDGPEAEQGTAAHWALAELLEGCGVVVEGQVAPNGIVLDAEMIDAAELAADTVADYVARYGAENCVVLIEQRLEPLPGSPDNWGTPDAVIWVRNIGLVIILDFKFGHRFVEEFENWQLLNYLKLKVGEMALTGLQDEHVRFELGVIQPRSYGSKAVRTWSGNLQDVRAHFNVIDNAIGFAQAPNPKATVNPECDFCPPRLHCRAFLEAGYRGMAVAQSPTVAVMSAEGMARELKRVREYEDVLKALRKGLEDQITQRIVRGERIPGAVLEFTSGREVWNVPIPQVLALGELFGKDLAKPAAAVTPVQARKLGLDRDTVAAMAHTPQGGSKLTIMTEQLTRKQFN